MNLFKDQLIRLNNNKYFINPYFLIEKSEMKLDYFTSKLSNIKNQFIAINTKLDNNTRIMKQILDNRVNKEELKIKHLNTLLKVYDVDNTLKRGYSLVYKDNNLIKSRDLLKNDDEIDIRLYGGTVRAKINEDI